MEEEKFDNHAFFGKDGLTSTSANHICNLAKEYYQSLETSLASIRFYTTELGLISSDQKSVISKGFNDVTDVPDMINRIAKAKSLIAWLREAIRARQDLIDNVKDLMYGDWLVDWCLETGEEKPQSPTMVAPLTEDEYYNSLSVAERNRYYTLETKASNLGKYIHPDGYISRAREDLKKKISEPNSVQANGRDTLIYSYKPTIDVETVDDLFFELQRQHREAQAELNSIKYKCQTAMEESKLQRENEYREALEKYNARTNELMALMNEQKTKKTREYGKLKIVIPDALKDIYEEIKALGKKD